MTKAKAIDEMVESLMYEAERNSVSLRGMTIDNFNTFLDTAFADGGETRCERFTDLAWEYSLRFGPLESRGFENAQWECIKGAISEIAKRVSKLGTE